MTVPTVSDRVAQTVVKHMIEPTLDPIFHLDSYGYRPGKLTKQAIAETRKRCWKYDWVLNLTSRRRSIRSIMASCSRRCARHLKADWILLCDCGRSETAASAAFRMTACVSCAHCCSARLSVVGRPFRPEALFATQPCAIFNLEYESWRRLSVSPFDVPLCSSRQPSIDGTCHTP
jgi:hypothetical protein